MKIAERKLTFHQCIAMLPAAAAKHRALSHWVINTYRDGCKLQLGWTSEALAVAAGRRSLQYSDAVVAVAVVDRNGAVVYADGRP